MVHDGEYGQRGVGEQVAAERRLKLDGKELPDRRKRPQVPEHMPWHTTQPRLARTRVTQAVAKREKTCTRRAELPYPMSCPKLASMVITAST